MHAHSDGQLIKNAQCCCMNKLAYMRDALLPLVNEIPRLADCKCSIELYKGKLTPSGPFVTIPDPICLLIHGAANGITWPACVGNAEKLLRFRDTEKKKKRDGDGLKSSSALTAPRSFIGGFTFCRALTHRLDRSNTDSKS